MANPFFRAMNAPQGGMNVMQTFPQFMQQMQGKNPNDLIQEMLSSGKINQSQLNQVQQIAKQIENQMSGFKSMFGF